ncbi:MAG: 30S ribosomal protein S8 [Patescibacteria group bacterium]
MTDPIADMLTRIRNASKVKKTEVYIPFSKIKLEMIKIFKKRGLIESFEEIKPGADSKFGGLMVSLKYEDSKPAITSLKKISKPGKRVYAAKDKLPRVLNGLGISIISTSRGLMTGDEAKKAGLGGEIICEIY